MIKKLLVKLVNWEAVRKRFKPSEREMALHEQTLEAAGQRAQEELRERLRQGQRHYHQADNSDDRLIDKIES